MSVFTGGYTSGGFSDLPSGGGAVPLFIGPGFGPTGPAPQGSVPSEPGYGSSWKEFFQGLTQTAVSLYIAKKTAKLSQRGMPSPVNPAPAEQAPEPVLVSPGNGGPVLQAGFPPMIIFFALAAVVGLAMLKRS